MITKASTDVVSELASFAILKSLSDEKKYQSPYQILKEFVTYIIYSESLRDFSAVEMKNLLTEYFDFNIPEAVVKTTLKQIDGITLANKKYSVNLPEIKTNSDFETKKKEADAYASKIIKLLSEYISERDNSLSVSEEILTQELADFLIEDQTEHSNRYTDLIGEFILKNEKDEDIQKGLNKIRQGSILYIGLSHNIGEVGSITKPLALYLSTEILFSFAGYNGAIYQQFTKDFYEQVCAANARSKKKVTLYYFSETKEEIDNFFYAAKQVVDGQKSSPLDSPAMSAITNGCETSADVDVKQADFYYKLQYEYGIKEDPNDNYYGEELFSSNLESSEYEDENDKKNKKDAALKFVSHIHKLRDGNYYHNDIESEYLIVTNTKATLLISKEQSDRIKREQGLEYICNFAVSMDRITSLLWYKLGKGFSKKQFPKSIAAILKARIALSSSIAKKTEEVYSDVTSEYQEGKITEEQVAARIIMIRKKSVLPENLQADNIDEIMDFSPEFLSRYEEQFKQTKSTLEEKEKLIEEIKKENIIRILEKDAEIVSQNEIIKNKDEENAQLRQKVEEYEQNTKDENAKKERRKNILLFVWSIIWKAIILIFVFCLIVLLDNKPRLNVLRSFLSAVELFGTLYTIGTAIGKDRKKYLSKGQKNQRDQKDQKNQKKRDS